MVVEGNGPTDFLGHVVVVYTEGGTVKPVPHVSERWCGATHKVSD
jgi:hypothetical protein